MKVCTQEEERGKEKRRRKRSGDSKPLDSLVEDRFHSFQPVTLVTLPQINRALFQSVQLVESTFDLHVGHEMEHVVVLFGQLLVKFKHLLPGKTERFEKSGETIKYTQFNPLYGHT